MKRLTKIVLFLALSVLTAIGTVQLFAIIPSPDFEHLLGKALYDSIFGLIIIVAPLPLLIIFLIWRLKKRIFG